MTFRGLIQETREDYLDWRRLCGVYTLPELWAHLIRHRHIQHVLLSLPKSSGPEKFEVTFNPYLNIDAEITLFKNDGKRAF